MQTKKKRENVEKEKRIEANREIERNKKDDVRIDCLIESCVDANVSNLIDLKTDKVIALKYDVMRLCMRSHLFAKLRLSKSRKKNERI